MKDIQWGENLPKCDFCAMDHLEAEAPYDGPTQLGLWANMCHEHLLMYGASDTMTMRRIIAKA